MKGLWLFPTGKDGVDPGVDLRPGVEAVAAGGQQAVIVGFRVAHVGADGEVHGVLGQILGAGAAADPAAVFPAGMLRDEVFPSSRTVRIEFPHAGGESTDEVLVEFCATQHGLGPADLPLAGIGLALPLGFFQGFVFDQHPLPLVLLARLAPLQHDRRKDGVLAGTTGQGGIARRQEHEMIQIRARQAQGLGILGRLGVGLERDPRVAAQICAAFVAGGFPRGDEDFQLGRWGGGFHGVDLR